MNRRSSIPETVTLHVPFRCVKRGGRKEMQLSEGAAQPRRPDNMLVRAQARAFRWKRSLAFFAQGDPARDTLRSARSKQGEGEQRSE